MFFIGAGAFHTAKPTDLIPELQGRFPVRVELENLTEETFLKILTLPENALIKQHKTLLSTKGVDLEFTDEGGVSFCEPIGHFQRDGDYRQSWQPQPISKIGRAHV